MKDLEEIPPEVVYMANGTTLEAKYQGTVVMSCKHKGEKTMVDVHRVLFVPGLKGNLLSVPQLATRGVRVEFTKDGCTLRVMGKPIAQAQLVGKLYRLDAEPVRMPRGEQVYALSAGGLRVDKGKLWHERLGHPGAAALKQLVSGVDLVRGLPHKVEVPGEVCPGCMKGKQARRPFTTAAPRSTRRLELTHIDLCGPMQVASEGGARFMLTIVDDATRHVSVYTLKRKSDAPGHIKFYKAALEARLGVKMLEIRTDRGREFLNKELGDYLKEHGILHNLTAPYTPQQNGVAERANRTLMECARSLLYARAVSLKMWAEAVTTSAYLRNHIPRKG
jgi:transposase InsO family protein